MPGFNFWVTDCVVTGGGGRRGRGYGVCSKARSARHRHDAAAGGCSRRGRNTPPGAPGVAQPGKGSGKWVGCATNAVAAWGPQPVYCIHTRTQGAGYVPWSAASRSLPASTPCRRPAAPEPPTPAQGGGGWGRQGGQCAWRGKEGEGGGARKRPRHTTKPGQVGAGCQAQPASSPCGRRGWGVGGGRNTTAKGFRERGQYWAVLHCLQ